MKVMEADLIVMPIEDYDLILGIDWLSKYDARVDCRNKAIQFVRPKRDMEERRGNQIMEPKFLIARIRHKRCWGRDAKVI
jgi:hypothetical protein